MGRVLGLIPAKGGSTRLARKNILPLAGKPLLAWAAESARDSGLIDRLIVSTEDEEVADVARGFDIDVPFMRPLDLARDPAGVSDVALHALEELRRRGEEFETLIILLATSPFRTAQDIRAAHDLFLRQGRPFLMSVSAFPHTPFAALDLAEDGRLEPFFPDCFGKKSQELPTAYRPNGALHILDVAAFERARSYVAQPLVGYVMPRDRSVDIDTADDLREAEAILAGKSDHD